jgi:hypothetical protein
VGHPPIAGVFQADPAIDHVLKLSEPPEHNRWSPGAQRLDGTDGPAIVKSILDGTWRALKEFQKRERPRAPDEGRKVGALERMLANYLNPSSKAPTGPGAGRASTPIHVDPRVEVVPFQDGLRMIGLIDVVATDDWTGGPVDIALGLVSTKEDGTRGVSIGLTVEGIDGAVRDGGRLKVRHAPAPGSTLRLELTSDVYPADWQVVFEPIVKPALEDAR